MPLLTQDLLVLQNDAKDLLCLGRVLLEFVLVSAAAGVLQSRPSLAALQLAAFVATARAAKDSFGPPWLA